MKNIKKKITNEYHKRELKELKDKIGLSNETYYVKKRSKLLIPSLVSLAASFVLVIAAFVFFIVSSPSDVIGPDYDSLYPTNTLTNIAVKKLKENTKHYIDYPMKTIFDTENNLFISVYYGIAENESKELSHYVVIFYESKTSVFLDTKIISQYTDSSESEDGIEENIIFNNSILLNRNKIEYFESTTTDILIEFTIKNNKYSLDINLDDYYNFLIK